VPRAATRTDLRTEPFPAIGESWATWPRGNRPGALREAAAQLRARLREGGTVQAIRTLDLAILRVPAGEVLSGAARPVLGPVPVVHRLVVVRFNDLGGRSRLLVWEPRVPDAPAADGGRPPVHERDTVASALGLLGIQPDEVDVCGLSHLHGQDPRLVLGTDVAVGTDRAPRPPLFPRAEVLLQTREADALRATHPLQRSRYTGAWHGVRTDLLRELEGATIVGDGVAVMATPGHTDGHQSLVLQTRRGIWVLSGAGHIADAWHPHLSRSPGVLRQVAGAEQEVLIGDGSENPIDQHDAMILERAVADAHHDDPRWRCVLPLAEIQPSGRTWPMRATFVHGGLHAGVLHPSES
jgi:hypothetical protein